MTEYEEKRDPVPIDITPMAIIGMLIVIVFLVASPNLMQPLMKVELPKAHTLESERKQNTTITIGPNEKIAVDDLSVTWEQLYPVLLVSLEINNDKFVIIRADRKSKYKHIIKAMHLAKKAGAKSLTIATEQKRKEK